MGGVLFSGEIPRNTGFFQDDFARGGEPKEKRHYVCRRYFHELRKVNERYGKRRS